MLKAVITISYINNFKRRSNPKHGMETKIYI